MTWEQLYALGSSGRLQPADLVWHPSLPEWVPASRVPGLFPPSPPSVAAYAIGSRKTPQASHPVAIRAAGQHRPWLVPVLIPVIALILVGSGMGAYLGLRGSGSTEQGEVLHFQSDVPAAKDYLADPKESIYDEKTGFSDDAVKVLTQASLQLCLERYRLDNGNYPASLDDLFPTYAPADQNDQPLTASPEGYAYTQTGGGSGYDLSVTLSAGKPYTVHQPASLPSGPTGE